LSVEGYDFQVKDSPFYQLVYTLPTKVYFTSISRIIPIALHYILKCMITLFLQKTAKTYSLLSLFAFILFSACTDEQNEFSLGENFIESQTSIKLIDTFAVQLSSVLLDSLPSSMIDTQLIGNYYDTIFGRVTCSSYFEVGLPLGTDVQDGDNFDSLTLIMWYTGYSYGDTLSPLNLLVYRLTESISLRESGYLYNTSSFSHENNPLASYSFYPEPNSKDSIEFRLSDEFGFQLFEMMRTDNDAISTDDLFLQYFKGLVIKTDTNLCASVIGFDVVEDHLRLKMYTHRVAETEKEIQYEFKVINTEKQFNQVEHNFSNTAISILNAQEEAIPSQYMNNKSFTQGGTGIMTKIEFPTLNDFLLFERSFILRVDLVIRPAKTSYNLFELPENIYLYHTDKNNEIGEILYNSDGEALTPDFVFDEVYYEETSYTFDITDFIKSEMADSYFNNEHGLIMTFSYEEYLCSLKRVVFEAGGKAAQLKIYYVNY
jgi:hypothetical protein